MTKSNVPNVTDYKNLLKAMRLTLNQKKVLYAICKEPTSHIYSSHYMKEHNITAGGITVALRKLQRCELIVQDAEVWRMRNQGMQKWLYAVLTSRSYEETLALQYGPWQFSDEFMKGLRPSVPIDFMDDVQDPPAESRELFDEWR
jgi:hypothetical protein